MNSASSKPVASNQGGSKQKKPIQSARGKKPAKVTEVVKSARSKMSNDNKENVNTMREVFLSELDSSRKNLVKKKGSSQLKGKRVLHHQNS